VISVFVYGTLKPEEVNYWVCEPWVIQKQPAITYASLYHLPLGYPAIAPGTIPVSGYLMQFEAEYILQRLDEFEQHDPAIVNLHAPEIIYSESQYQRQLISVFDLQGRALGQAWAYTMTLAQVEQLGGQHLPEGYWTGKQAI
jgi:gamma-glutamylcyclotransferase (GGCT)/AIG2-like uncharacterized protein YtfP